MSMVISLIYEAHNLQPSIIVFKLMRVWGTQSWGDKDHSTYRFVMWIWHDFSCDQAAVRTLLSVCRLYVCPSVRLSVRSSVCLLSQHFYYVPLIVSSWALTIDISNAHATGIGQRSKAKVTKFKTNCAPNWAFPGHNPSLNFKMVTKWCTKLEMA